MLSAVAVLSIVVIGVSVAQAQARSVSASREAAAYTPPAIPTPSPAATGPLVAVVGDGSALASGTGERSWTSLLQADVGGRTEVAASEGAGYTVPGTNGSDFEDAASAVPVTASVVVFVGSASDARADAAALARSASQAFQAAADRAPVARIVVVAPITSGSATRTQLQAEGRALRAAARVGGFDFADPTDDSWLQQPRASVDQLTEADERRIASRVAELVRTALG